MNSSIFLLLGSASIGTFGASLFWTGFPVYFASTTGVSWSLSGIYTLATLGTLLCTLVGGAWGDSGNYRKLAIQSHFVSFLLILAIFAITLTDTKQLLLFILPILYFNFSIGYISENVWLLKSTETIDFQKRILDRTMLSLVSKLLGFSLGPVLFLSIGKTSLFICGAAFLTTAIIQFFLDKNLPPLVVGDSTSVKVSLKKSYNNIIALFSSAPFVLSALLTGMLSIPFNPLFVLHLERIGTAKDISLFWLIAGISGFIATLVMRKTKILNFNKWFILVSVLMCGFLHQAFVNNNPLIVILFAALFVFSSIQFSAKTHVLTAVLSKSETLGSSVGSVTFLTDLGVFLGMLLGTLASTVPFTWVVYCSWILIGVRWIAFAKFLRFSESNIVK